MSQQQTKTVWVTKLHRSTQEKIYHTDEACINLNRSDSIVKKQLNVLSNDMRECKLCKSDSDCKPNQPNKKCPYCGELVGKLPSHLPECDET